jgi:hypothetical protein
LVTIFRAALLASAGFVFIAEASAAPAAGLASAPVSVPAITSSAPAPFRLQLSAASLPADGSYITNDLPSFMIDRHDGQVRLRFAGSDEVFYLSSEPAALGGRILKYDTGDVALAVAGWGGVTLYTEDSPAGIPAERQAAVVDFEPKPVAPKDMKSMADKLARDLAQHGPFSIGFSADWDALVKQADAVRAMAIDAMRNAAYALEQMGKEEERNAVGKTLRTVRVTQGPQPGVSVNKDALVVSYAPKRGPSARPSSLAIAHALEEAF